jgi:two-component system CheB/CheR fusion protein
MNELQQKENDTEEIYRTISENIGDLIEILDEDYKIEYFNEKAHLYLLDYSRHEIIGRSMRTFIFAEDLERTFNSFSVALEKGESKSEFRMKHKKGHVIWIEAKIKCIPDSNNAKKLLLISREITERKNVEKFVTEITERRKTENLFKKEIKKLKELDKIKKDLISGVSHELKTPLMSITGASELLLNMYKDQIGKDASELIVMIERGGHRLGELIEKLLDISRIEYSKLELEKKSENLSEIIKACTKDMNYVLKARELRVNLEIPDVFHVNLDKLRIEQVITNILSNAIKNSPPQGIITISLEEKNEWAEMIVSDTGIGLTEEEMEKVFTRFGKIERYGPGFEYIDIQGSGLGLFITKEILALHGGEICVKSEGRHKGSSFIVRIPIE